MCYIIHTWNMITIFYLDTMVTDGSKHGLHINHNFIHVKKKL